MNSVKSLFTRNILWQSFSISIIILIFIVSGRPALDEDTGLDFPHLDKILHFLAWLVLGFSLRLSFYGYFKQPWKRVLIAILLGSFYGIFDEIHQSFVPTRVADITDWLADTLGAIIGSILGEQTLSADEQKLVVIKAD
ncbi:MAG: VanZ family protein [Candidatus Hodarchaeales archaeon]|jgi:hypothetical protein